MPGKTNKTTIEIEGVADEFAVNVLDHEFPAAALSVGGPAVARWDVSATHPLRDDRGGGPYSEFWS